MVGPFVKFTLVADGTETFVNLANVVGMTPVSANVSLLPIEEEWVSATEIFFAGGLWPWTEAYGSLGGWLPQARRGYGRITVRETLEEVLQHDEARQFVRLPVFGAPNMLHEWAVNLAHVAYLQADADVPGTYVSLAGLHQVGRELTSPGWLFGGTPEGILRQSADRDES